MTITLPYLVLILYGTPKCPRKFCGSSNQKDKRLKEVTTSSMGIEQFRSLSCWHSSANITRFSIQRTPITPFPHKQNLCRVFRLFCVWLLFFKTYVQEKINNYTQNILKHTRWFTSVKRLYLRFNLIFCKRVYISVRLFFTLIHFVSLLFRPNLKKNIFLNIFKYF